jgi:hypothetical protein
MKNCEFEIPLATMRAHLNETHGASLHKDTQRSVTKMKSFGINSAVTWKRAILFSDEIFVHVSKVRNNGLYTCVLHVGLEEQTSKFSYSVRIGSLEATHGVRNYKCDLNQLFGTRKCGIFSCPFAKIYAGKENVLKMSVNFGLRP